MVTRRKFIATGGLATLGATMGIASSGLSGFTKSHTKNFKSMRPAVQDRKFTSEAVEKKIREVQKQISDPELAWMFGNCFPNTLDTTVKHYHLDGKPDAFIVTGDIDAMWLRDSTAQIWPYLPLTNDDKKLALLVEGVINRQARCVSIDPFANAFTYGSQKSEHLSDKTEMKEGVFERKWEVDSLCYVIRLAYGYWKASGNTAPFDMEWLHAMRLIVKTFNDQQRKKNNGSYSFRRITEIPFDTAQGDGTGNPVRPTGMICSVFRPSDDATIFPFLVPSNFFAVQSLRQLAEMSSEILNQTDFSKECLSLAVEVQTAIHQHAILDHKTYGRIFAYETDGYGSMLIMDDANVPNLLSLPYIARMDATNEIYRNTRRMVLSPGNPYYFHGNYAGVGSPHTGRDNIWPLGYIMRAMTSHDKNEIGYCVRMLKETSASTGFIHESFQSNDPSHYTRSWFAWANTQFGELILKLAGKKLV